MDPLLLHIHLSVSFPLAPSASESPPGLVLPLEVNVTELVGSLFDWRLLPSREYLMHTTGMLTAAGCVYDQIYTLAYLYDIAGNLDPPHRKSRLQPLCHRRRLLAGKRNASGQEMYTASTTAVPQNRTTRGENISPDLSATLTDQIWTDVGASAAGKPIRSVHLCCNNVCTVLYNSREKAKRRHPVKGLIPQE